MTPTAFLPVPHPRHLILSATAMERIAASDPDGALKAVTEIQNVFGDPGLLESMVMWADAAGAFAWPETPRGDPVPLHYQYVDTKEDVPADDVPYGQRWAGRWIAARKADDRDTAQALIDSAAADDMLDDCIAAVLYVAAHTVDGALDEIIGETE